MWLSGNIYTNILYYLLNSFVLLIRSSLIYSYIIYREIPILRHLAQKLWPWPAENSKFPEVIFWSETGGAFFLFLYFGGKDFFLKKISLE